MGPAELLTACGPKVHQASLYHGAGVDQMEAVCQCTVAFQKSSRSVSVERPYNGA